MKFCVILLALVLCNSNAYNQALSKEKDVKRQITRPIENQNLQDTSIAGSWQLQPVLASDTASGRLAQINFDIAKGKFTGNTGCNSMNGSFVVKGDSLKIQEDLITTKMACPGYNEKALIESLHNTNGYRIQDGVLQLMNNKTVLSKWVRPGKLKENKI